MTRLQIDLPDEIETQVRARAAAAGCASAEEYVQALILEELADLGVPEHLSFKTESELEAFLIRRLDSPDIGEMRQADFDAIRARVGKKTAPPD